MAKKKKLFSGKYVELLQSFTRLARKLVNEFLIIRFYREPVCQAVLRTSKKSSEEFSSKHSRKKKKK